MITHLRPVKYLAERYTPSQIGEAFVSTRVLEVRFSRASLGTRRIWRKMNPRDFLGILTTPELQTLITYLDKKYLPTVQMDLYNEILKPDRSIIDK